MTIGGFPVRPSRNSFGSPLENWGPVRNPKREIGGETFNLAWATLAAAGQSLPLAQLHISSGGLVLARTEAWNPNGDLSITPPTVTAGAGTYTIVYPATAPDLDGVARTLAFRAAKVFLQTTSDYRAVALISSSTTITVKVRNNLGGGAACEFLMELW